MNKTLSNKIKSFGMLLFSLSIVACNDGSSGSTNYSTKDAYFTNNGKNTYTQCSVGSNGIEPATCVIVTPTSPGALKYPTGIAFNKSYAYFSNFADYSYTQCSVESKGIESTTCVTVKPESPGKLNHPTGIAFNESYAYFTNQFDDSYTQCSVGSNGIESTTCFTVTQTSPGALNYPTGKHLMRVTPTLLTTTILTRNAA